LWLQHYILVKRPQLRIHRNVSHEIYSFRISRAVFVILAITFLMVTITFCMIPDTTYKYFAWWWFFIFPFLLKTYKRRLDKKYPKSKE